MRSGNTFKAFSFTDERHIGTTWRALSKEIGDLIKQCSIVGKPVASSRTEAVSCGLRWQINRRLTSSLTEGRYRRNRDEKNWVAIAATNWRPHSPASSDYGHPACGAGAFTAINR